MTKPSKFQKGHHIYTKWGSKGKEVRVMSGQEESKRVELKIEMDDTIAQGIYANLAFITHNETEFTLDFIYVQPQQPKAKVRARILSSPPHTKRLLKALEDNVKRYESKFGAIKEVPEMDRRIGF